MFKKLFTMNSKDYSTNKQMKRSLSDYRKKEFSKEPLICYECKGRGHIAENYGNKKNKVKTKGKAMAAT